MVDHFVEAGGGAGSAVEKRLGGVEEGVGAGLIVLEIAREGEMGQGVPFVWASFVCGEARVGGEEAPNGGFVAQNSGRIDVGGGDFGVASEDELRVFERAGRVAGVARDAANFDEGGDGIGDGFYGLDDAQGL